VRIGMIFYSYSGHTAQVINQLEFQLSQTAVQVTKHALEPQEPLQLNALTVALRTLPEVDEFDALILGTPVHGGRMSAPVRTFLEETKALEGLPVAFLLTHFFPRKWGAVQTVAAMKTFCQSKGARVLGSADVTWLSLGRKKQINDCIEQVEKLLVK